MAPSRSGPSQRQLRVGELIRHELAMILARGDISDPEVDWPAVTVTEVSMSPDLRHATCYVRSFRSGADAAMLEALRRHSRFLRGLLTPKLKLKFMPDLRFETDRSADYAQKIDALLRDPSVARDLGTDRDD